MNVCCLVLFMFTEAMSWSESRQFCKNRGADLVIIKSEEKQRLISSLVKEDTWIGLSDKETEGTMKWVDNSPLNQGFWSRGEPNNAVVNEDCIEMTPTKPILNNWNDEQCSREKKGICEKSGSFSLVFK
ncbi:CD209 antigen-like [Danio aesculapii]|uniref:CD209 antigen-like n=1 Tax=Danio aesculapii TaxID=1142201 RepID=UPI0024BF1748|nr:CD209 antigen-like [Danio aesculapii]